MLKKQFTFILSVMMVLQAFLVVLCYAENSESAGEMPSYKASDYYDKTKPSNGPWACQYYMPSVGYQNMPKNIGWVTNFSDDGKSNGNAWVQGKASDPSLSELSLSVAVGNYYMRPGVNEDKTGYTPLLTSKAVRTFTAPHAGKISITADDGAGNSRITGTTNKGAFVRIMYDGQMVWPHQDSMNLYGAEMTGGTGYITAEPFTLNVKKGDKIYFEVHNGNTRYNYWAKRTYWDPVVTYVDDKSYAEPLVIKDKNGDTLDDFEDIINSGECTLSTTVHAIYEELGNVTMIAAAYDKNGTIVSVDSTNQRLETDDVKDFKMSLNFSGKDVEKIKVFTWKGLDNLSPINIEGITGTELNADTFQRDDSWMPSYIHLSGDFIAPYSGKIKIGEGETEQTVTAGETVSLSGEENVKYTNVWDDTITIEPKFINRDGYTLFAAEEFFRLCGVIAEDTGEGLVGSFNNAEFKIPFNGNIVYYDDVNIELTTDVVKIDDVLYVDSEFFEDLYGVSINGREIAATIYKPERKTDYNAIISKLESGEAVYDGDEIYTINQSSSGKFSMAEATPDDGRFSKVLKMVTETEPTTKVEYLSSRIYNNKAYSKGDILILSFWARATEISDDTGSAYVGVRLERPVTWVKDVVSSVLVDSGWKKYYIPFEAKSDVAVGGIKLQFYCGFKPQTVEIADFSVINYKDTIKLSDVKDIDKRDTYKGRENDALWRREALKRIEKYRTDTVTVKVVDAAGNPVPNAPVKAKMTRSAFMFGTEHCGDYLEPIRNCIAENCNALTISELKLGMYDTVAIERGLKLAADNDMYTRGHALVYDRPSYMWNDNVKNSSTEKQWNMYETPYTISETDAKNKFDAYIKDRLTKYPNLTQWDLLNEPISNNTFLNRFGYNFGADWFKTFKENANDSKAYVNQCSISGGESEWSLVDEYVKIINRLKNENASIDGAGIQGHLRSLIYPQTFYNQLDKISESVDEIMVTEYDCVFSSLGNSIKQDDILKTEADMLRDILIAVYSHPKAKGFVAWGVCDRIQTYSSGILLDMDYNEKPGMKVWKDLVLNEWKTDISGTTNEKGEFTFKGHFGDYDILSGTTTQKHSITQGGDNTIRITIN